MIARICLSLARRVPYANAHWEREFEAQELLPFGGGSPKNSFKKDIGIFKI